MPRRGDRQNAADLPRAAARGRLDPMDDAGRVDQGDHGLTRRSRAAGAEQAEARRGISFARRRSRFARASVAEPGRTPRSRPACRTRCGGVSPEPPIVAAVEPIANPCAARSPWLSRTLRTARARTAGEYRGGIPRGNTAGNTAGEYEGTRFVVAPSSQALQPPETPARVTASMTCRVTISGLGRRAWLAA